jgi:hypothetical protein
MIGRLNSVMTELGALGAVFRPAPAVTLPVTSEQVAGTATLSLPSDPTPVLSPASEPPPSPDEAIVPVDEDVEAKIRALSEMATGAVSPSYSELRSAFERNEEDDEEDEDEEDLPEVAEAIPEPVSPPRKLRVRAAPSHTARRLKEAFARLDLLEACVADLRDSLLAVASSINEES